MAGVESLAKRYQLKIVEDAAHWCPAFFRDGTTGLRERPDDGTTGLRDDRTAGRRTTGRRDDRTKDCGTTEDYGTTGRPDDGTAGTTGHGLRDSRTAGRRDCGTMEWLILEWRSAESRSPVVPLSCSPDSGLARCRSLPRTISLLFVLREKMHHDG